MKKFNIILGLIFLIAGIILLFNDYNGSFAFEDNMLAISFTALAFALFFIAGTNTPDNNEQK